MKTDKLTGRIAYLDAARGVAVILMIAGHLLGALQQNDNKAWFEPVCRVIVSFHMPLFFILSGMVLRVKEGCSRNLKQVAVSKARALLIPYAIFSVCYWFLYLGMHLKHPESTGMNVVWEQLIRALTFRGISVLWFLPALWIAEMLFLFVFKTAGNKAGTLIISLAGLMMLCFSPVFRWNGWENRNYGMMALGALLLTLSRGILAAAFIMVGWYLYPLIPVAGRRKAGRWIGFIVGGILILTGGALSFANTTVDMNYMIFGNIVIFAVCAVCESVGVILLCRFGFPFKLLRWLGENSLVIMATHMDFRVLKVSIDLGYFASNHVSRAKEWIFFGSIVLCILILEGIIIVLSKYLFFWALGKRSPYRDPH